ncbi:MAG: HTTM domain-containing protein [Terriglobales bacterium]
MSVLDRPLLDVASAAAARLAVKRDRKNPLRSLAAYLQAAYSLDLRSLALFRMALGAVLLGDLILRSFDLTAFYTDFGVLPREVLLEKFSPADRFSIHLISGQFLFQAFLFLVAGLFAVMLIFGIRTRVASIASWFLLVSLQMRNPSILQGGDVYLRVLTFIAMFLPLGALYSVDSALNQASPRQDKSRSFTHFSTPGLALMAQVALVYIFAVLLKTAPEWRSEHSAVFYALSIQQMSTPLGRFLLHFPKLLPWLTRGTMVHEGTIPLLILTPIFAAPARVAAVALIFALHIGLGLSIRLGHFPYIACMAALPLLPTWFWERPWILRIVPWAAGAGNWGAGVRMFYDSNCVFCSKLVRVLKAFLLIPGAELVPAQEFPITELEMRDRRSWIVVTPEATRLYKWNALAELVSHSPIFCRIAPLMRSRALASAGERLYENIESHREQLSAYTSWIRPRPLSLRTPPAVTVFALLFILFVSLWNLTSIMQVPFQPWEDTIGLTLAIDQKWDMFAPNPLTYDGWYVIEGRLRDGRPVDVLHPRQRVSYQQPASIADQYKNERWRKYLMNLSLSENTNYRLYYGQYLCRSWNEDRPPYDPVLLISFDIYFMAHQTSINHPPAPFSRDLLWHHECFK